MQEQQQRSLEGARDMTKLSPGKTTATGNFVGTPGGYDGEKDSPMKSNTSSQQQKRSYDAMSRQNSMMSRQNSLLDGYLGGPSQQQFSQDLSQAPCSLQAGYSALERRRLYGSS